MGKGVFMMMVITIMVLGLLLTGCEQTLQIMGPTLEEPEMIEPGILEPETPVNNTGDCISQVGPVTSQGGQSSLQECLEREDDEDLPDPDN